MRLIDADALIEDIDGDLTDSIAEGRAIEKIMNAPTIEERKKGKWIKYVSPINENDGQDAWDCSECAAMVGRPTNYCPRCGARMER